MSGQAFFLFTTLWYVVPMDSSASDGARELWIGNIPQPWSVGDFFSWLAQMGLPIPWKTKFFGRGGSQHQYSIVAMSNAEDAMRVLTSDVFPDGKPMLVRLNLPSCIPPWWRWVGELSGPDRKTRHKKNPNLYAPHVWICNPFVKRVT